MAGSDLTQALVGKWASILAVRLPGEIVRAARLRDGESIEIEAQADTIVIRQFEPAFTLESLFQGKIAEERRAAYSGAYDSNTKSLRP